MVDSGCPDVAKIALLVRCGASSPVAAERIREQAELMVDFVLPRSGVKFEWELFRAATHDLLSELRHELPTLHSSSASASSSAAAPTAGQPVGARAVSDEVASELIDALQRRPDLEPPASVEVTALNANPAVIDPIDLTTRLDNYAPVSLAILLSIHFDHARKR